jgi:hypothetical protein
MAKLELGEEVIASKSTNADKSTTSEKATTVINTLTNPTSGTTYFPTFIAGTTNNNNYGIRTQGDFQFYTLQGTTSTVGIAQLILGNSTSSGTAGNKQGIIKLFSQKSGANWIKCVASQTSSYENFLPQHAGYILSSTSLYDNSSGTTGTVTLSETAANFNYLEIFYQKKNSYTNAFTQHSTKVYSPNGKKVSLIWGAVETSAVNQVSFSTKTISGTSITHNYAGYINAAEGSVPVSMSTNEIYIIKVIGWK